MILVQHILTLHFRERPRSSTFLPMRKIWNSWKKKQFSCIWLFHLRTKMSMSQIENICVKYLGQSSSYRGTNQIFVFFSFLHLSRYLTDSFKSLLTRQGGQNTFTGRWINLFFCPCTLVKFVTSLNVSHGYLNYGRGMAC